MVGQQTVEVFDEKSSTESKRNGFCEIVVCVKSKGIRKYVLHTTYVT